MLPQNTSSSISFGGMYYPPDERVTTPIVDYELGGIALQDTSQGLLVRAWRARLDDRVVKLQPDGGAEIALFEESDITEIALCFDQNMRWCVAYVQQGVLKLRWYDSLVAAYVTTVFTEAANPKMALDDKRVSQSEVSDMILAYLRGTSLYYRQQRDRFQIERLLRSNLFPGTKLKNIGMNRNLRMQFELV